jgi:hypothetical protein
VIFASLIGGFVVHGVLLHDDYRNSAASFEPKPTVSNTSR